MDSTTEDPRADHLVFNDPISCNVYECTSIRYDAKVSIALLDASFLLDSCPRPSEYNGEKSGLKPRHTYNQVYPKNESFQNEL